MLCHLVSDTGPGFPESQVSPSKSSFLRPMKQQTSFFEYQDAACSHGGTGVRGHGVTTFLRMRICSSGLFDLMTSDQRHAGDCLPKCRGCIRSSGSS